jgi:hypothetical protein
MANFFYRAAAPELGIELLRQQSSLSVTDARQPTLENQQPVAMNDSDNRQP